MIYGITGSATYSQTYNTLDEVLSYFPDNNASIIKPIHFRNSLFTLWNLKTNPDFQEVLSKGNKLTSRYNIIDCSPETDFKIKAHDIAFEATEREPGDSGNVQIINRYNIPHLIFRTDYSPHFSGLISGVGNGAAIKLNSSKSGVGKLQLGTSNDDDLFISSIDIDDKSVIMNNPLYLNSGKVSVGGLIYSNIEKTTGVLYDSPINITKGDIFKANYLINSSSNDDLKISISISSILLTEIDIKQGDNIINIDFFNSDDSIKFIIYSLGSFLGKYEIDFHSSISINIKTESTFITGELGVIHYFPKI